jgi:hypothetical protein
MPKKRHLEIWPTNHAAEEFRFAFETKGSYRVTDQAIQHPAFPRPQHALTFSAD